MSDKPAWMQLRPSLTATDVSNLTGQYRDRLAAMRAVDDLIGTLVAKLVAQNEMSRTVFVFTSDNGYLLGQHRLPQKLTAHEESIRIPLVVGIPGRGPAEANQIVINNDLAPTIAEIAGAATPGTVDGTSFASLLSNPNVARWRQRFLIERWPGAQSIFELPSYFAVRTGPATPYVPNQTFVQYSDGSREFYDLNVSVWETDSLHADPSPLRMYQQFIHQSWLNQLIGCAGSVCRDREFH